MMKTVTRNLLAFAVFMVPSVTLAGHSGLTVPPGDTFLLGGEQRDVMTVSGKNVGQTQVAILSRSGSTDTEIATVAPGGKFQHRYPVGQIALIRNLSTTREARLSVDFTGSPNNLSMRYALPQKD